MYDDASGGRPIGIGCQKVYCIHGSVPHTSPSILSSTFFLPPLAHSNLITGPSLPLPRNPWTASQRRPESAPCFPTRDAPPPHLLRIKLTEAS